MFRLFNEAEITLADDIDNISTIECVEIKLNTTMKHTKKQPVSGCLQQWQKITTRQAMVYMKKIRQALHFHLIRILGLVHLSNHYHRHHIIYYTLYPNHIKRHCVKGNTKPIRNLTLKYSCCLFANLIFVIMVYLSSINRIVFQLCFNFITITLKTL